MIALDIKDKDLQPKWFKQKISHFKNELIAYRIDCSKLGPKKGQVLPKVYSLYQEKLKEYGALDFDDLLFVVVELFAQIKKCSNIINIAGTCIGR